MALDTGQLIRRSQYRVIPVTAEVRARVEQLGANEPRHLTWYNRHGEVIGDSPAWVASPSLSKNLMMIQFETNKI